MTSDHSSLDKRTEALMLLRGESPVLACGEVWLVGAGPGDPGLLTLDALAGLMQADVIVHDALVDSRVLALAHPEAEICFAGKRGGKPSFAQEDISAQLVALARRGLRVLRLKGGDPFVFGRGGEELLALAAAGIPFRVFPGITAGLGALASAGIPATMRGINQAIIFATGHGVDEAQGLDWGALARTGQPLVLYMGLRNLDHVVTALLRGGLSPVTPAALIASATLPGQQTVVTTLAGLVDAANHAQMAPPTLVVIGEIVRLREQLMTGPRRQGGTFPEASDP